MWLEHGGVQGPGGPGKWTLRESGDLRAGAGGLGRYVGLTCFLESTLATPGLWVLSSSGHRWKFECLL